MLKRVLEEGERVIILVNSNKVVHRSPNKCSEWILAWMLNGRPNIFLDEPGLVGGSRTIVSWALRTSHQAVLRLLLDRRKIKSYSIAPALIAATIHGNGKAVGILMDRALKLNPWQKDFSEPLKIATSHNKVNLVKILLEKGANPSVSPYGKPLFKIAEERGHMELAGLLMEKQIRADANFIDFTSQRSALYLAVQLSDEALVKYVLEKGAFVDVDPQDPGGNSPFRLALERGDKAIIKLLARHGGIDYCKSVPYKPHL